ncbi:unnamed protein product [Ectocarpus sp. 12 AP-2014]
MGQRGDIVTVSDLCQTMAYYATMMGYLPEWESSSPSPTFAEFERRPGVFKTMLKKVDNWTTLTGTRKIASVKKRIRVAVHAKTMEMRGNPSSLGVFAEKSGVAVEMQAIYQDTDPKRIICTLHRLGQHSQDDPRFYIHMVYRYYMNDSHKQLADDELVLRYPSLQKVMDIKLPVGCTGSIPPEFRAFMKSAGGSVVSVVTLPVPSKTEANAVVYGQNFESCVPWVPVLRAKIQQVFVDLRSCGSGFRQIYPRYLIKGQTGSPGGNRVIVDALARSIDMKGVVQTLHSFHDIPPETMALLTKAVKIDDRVAHIFPRYNSHPFRTEGEQLRERIGFFLQDSVRGVFGNIVAKARTFCNDVYVGLGISFVTMDVFNEFATSRASMKFQRRDEDMWRNFIIDIRRVSSVLHAWSRKKEADDFLEKHGSIDGYLLRVTHELS